MIYLLYLFNLYSIRIESAFSRSFVDVIMSLYLINDIKKRANARARNWGCATPQLIALS